LIRIFQRLLTERGLPQVLRGNCAFLTRKLWGIYSEPGFGHHGQFTTMREAIRGISSRPPHGSAPADGARSGKTIRAS
jgi:hypothetical protein